MGDNNKLLDKKKVGDNITVANMMETTPANVYWLLRRTGAKRHMEAVSALAKVIEARDKLTSK